MEFLKSSGRRSYAKQRFNQCLCIFQGESPNATFYNRYMMSTELTPAEMKDLALRMTAEHGLSDWTVELTDSRRMHGRCITATKTIQLSRRSLFRYGTAEAKDTILHEIAHAICPRHGHGKEWRNIAYRIGVRDRLHGRYNLNKAVREPAPLDRAKEDSKRLKRAQSMVKRTNTRIKRLQAALSRWERRVRLYERRTRTEATA